MLVNNIKNIIFISIMLFLVDGCAHKPKQIIEPNKPHESPVNFNFRSTPKDDAKFFQTIGLESFKNRDWGQAQQCLEKAVKLDSKLYLSWYYLGLLNIDKQEGYNYLKKSVETKPDFPLPYYWMAYYYCRSREDQKAISLFEKYIGLAERKPGEENRLIAAKEVLRELKSGKDGDALTSIRGEYKK